MCCAASEIAPVFERPTAYSRKAAAAPAVARARKINPASAEVAHPRKSTRPPLARAARQTLSWQVNRSMMATVIDTVPDGPKPTRARFAENPHGHSTETLKAPWPSSLAAAAPTKRRAAQLHPSPPKRDPKLSLKAPQLPEVATHCDKPIRKFPVATIRIGTLDWRTLCSKSQQNSRAPKEGGQ